MLTRTWLGSPSTVLWGHRRVHRVVRASVSSDSSHGRIQGIPTEFYEAATLDGAGRWRQFRDITFPLLRNQLQVALVFLGIGALDMFALVQVMAEGGGPSRGADVVARYMYDAAFAQSRFG